MHFSIKNMDPKPQAVNSTDEWRQTFAQSATTLEALTETVKLPKPSPHDEEAARQYPVLVPQPYLDRIQQGCPSDPLLLQVLPRREETLPVEGFGSDPIGECAATGPLGLIRKFHGRALIVTNGSCSVHCRFCFRRHALRQPDSITSPLWNEWAAAIAEDPSISEVILSGGDPLILADEELQEGLAILGKISHIRRFRIHTRLPITIPGRISDNLIQILRHTGRMCLLVIHINHRNEIDQSVEVAFRRLREAGIPLMSQTVLLRGVNDSVEAMADLCEALADTGVIPYYLHQLDRVAGAAHFEVPQAEGARIVRRLRAILPGYAVPRYVKERIGAAWKEQAE